MSESDRDDTDVFDRDRALAALDNDLELLSEMADLFLADSVGLIEQIRFYVSG